MSFKSLRERAREARSWPELMRFLTGVARWEAALAPRFISTGPLAEPESLAAEPFEVRRAALAKRMSWQATLVRILWRTAVAAATAPAAWAWVICAGAKAAAWGGCRWESRRWRGGIDELGVRLMCVWATMAVAAVPLMELEKISTAAVKKVFGWAGKDWEANKASSALGIVLAAVGALAGFAAAPIAWICAAAVSEWAARDSASTRREGKVRTREMEDRLLWLRSCGGLAFEGDHRPNWRSAAKRASSLAEADPKGRSALLASLLELNGVSGGLWDGASPDRVPPSGALAGVAKRLALEVDPTEELMRSGYWGLLEAASGGNGSTAAAWLAAAAGRPARRLSWESSGLAPLRSAWRFGGAGRVSEVVFEGVSEAAKTRGPAAASAVAERLADLASKHGEKEIAEATRSAARAWLEERDLMAAMAAAKRSGGSRL